MSINRWQRFGIGIGTVAVIVGLAYWFIMAPASGVIETGNPKKTAKVVANWVSEQNKYISFSRPSSFISIPVEPVTRPTLVGYRYRDRTATIPQNLTVQVRELPSGNITDDGDYNYRVTANQLFLRQMLRLHEQEVPYFVAADQSSEIVFLVHGMMLASVYISGGTQVEHASIAATIQQIAESISWQ